MRTVTIVFLLFSSIAFAQKQGNIWYFGKRIGMDFNTVPPTFIDTSSMGHIVACGQGHIEGTASIADSTGQLLFYTNGKKVWNQDHLQLQNGSGLMGGTSSTQSSLIVPKPNSQTEFYLFTTDDFCNDLANGFRYSLIDMCGDNGLGQVKPSEKNVFLLGTVAEKLAATRHANGIDYWVVVHKYFSNEFHAFLVTEDGIEGSFVSAVGSVHGIDQADLWDALGQMKISPIGNKLAICAANGANILELFDFDNQTGAVSNPVDLMTEDVSWSYGLSFSPDGTKLYGGGRIEQWNLLAGGAQDIVDSRIRISETEYSRNGYQCGPDGKIYIVTIGDKLDVVQAPDELGFDCNLEEEGFDLHGTEVLYALPSFIDSYDYGNAGSCYLATTDRNDYVEEFQLFPNPTNGKLVVEYKNQFQGGNIRILDCQGSQVFEGDLPISSKSIRLSMEIQEGLYLVTLENGKHRISQRLVVVKR